jgi:hypothetical protein
MLEPAELKLCRTETRIPSGPKQIRRFYDNCQQEREENIIGNVNN